MIFYLAVSILYCAIFVAWMKTKEPDDRRSTNEYWDFGDWQPKYIMLGILGTILWPLIIPFITFYKIAFKILNKTKNNL